MNIIVYLYRSHTCSFTVAGSAGGETQNNYDNCKLFFAHKSYYIDVFFLSYDFLCSKVLPQHLRMNRLYLYDFHRYLVIFYLQLFFRCVILVTTIKRGAKL